MRTRGVSLALLTLLLGVAALTLVACGDDDGGDTTTEIEQGAEEAGSAAEEGAEDVGSAAEEGAEDAGSAAEEGAGEAGSAAEEGANEAAPSGDAVRAERVEIVEFAYEPDPVTIEQGGKVTWINMDPEPHTATADDGSFDTGNLEKGKLKSETFKEAGEFTYFCELHPSMKGTVEVVESG
jgi:plastocyanin